MSLLSHFLRRPLVKILLIWGLALVYVCYLIGFAHVRLPFMPATSAPITLHQAATSADAALQYWTPQRMRSASDDDQVLAHLSALGAQHSHQNQSNLSQAHRRQGVPPKQNDAPSYPQYPLSTVGKIFFTSEGHNYSCSGAALVSDNHNTVNTAGHCLYWAGWWSEKVIFCPLYNYGEGPYGCWPARELAVPSDWIKPSEYYEHDMGMVVVAATRKGDLTDRVGGAGWAYNQAAGQYFYAYGYPAGKPFDGETMQACEGKGTAKEEGSGWAISIGCDMTGGSSGGPWFIKDGTNWFINGHVDFGYIDLPGVLFSPLYNENWYALYQQAQQV